MARTTTKVCFEVIVDSSFCPDASKQFDSKTFPAISHVYHCETCDNKPESMHHNEGDFWCDWFRGDRFALASFIYSRSNELYRLEQGHQWNTPRSSERGPRVQSILVTQDPVLINHMKVVRGELYAQWQVVPTVEAALELVQ
jgi:hypothetical protein